MNNVTALKTASYSHNIRISLEYLMHEAKKEGVEDIYRILRAATAAIDEEPDVPFNQLEIFKNKGSNTLVQFLISYMSKSEKEQKEILGALDQLPI